VKVTVTGATGLIGSRLCAELRKRGDDVTAVAREWPPEVLVRRDAVVHLAGERIAQRWNDEVKARIRASRVEGTHRLVDALHKAEPRPTALVCASGADYYGDTGDIAVDESAAAGTGYLAQVCVEWEEEANRAAELGLRVTSLRSGPVLSRSGGALAKMILPFRLGLGGRVGSGRQWFSWIALDDIVGLYADAVHGGEDWAGAINACAPEPVTNADFAKALGRALHRPAVLPIPPQALELLYGDMAQIVTGGVRMVPARARQLGYRYRHPDLGEALRAALA
jgi:uncharacterized protein (TIGR01777 family)